MFDETIANFTSDKTKLSARARCSRGTSYLDTVPERGVFLTPIVHVVINFAAQGVHDRGLGLLGTVLAYVTFNDLEHNRDG